MIGIEKWFLIYNNQLQMVLTSLLKYTSSEKRTISQQSRFLSWEIIHLHTSQIREIDQ